MPENPANEPKSENRPDRDAKKPAPTRKAVREDRLAEALRANLRRRKQADKKDD